MTDEILIPTKEQIEVKKIISKIKKILIEEDRERALIRINEEGDIAITGSNSPDGCWICVNRRVNEFCKRDFPKYHTNGNTCLNVKYEEIVI